MLFRRMLWMSYSNFSVVFFSSTDATLIDEWRYFSGLSIWTVTLFSEVLSPSSKWSALLTFFWTHPSFLLNPSTFISWFPGLYAYKAPIILCSLNICCPLTSRGRITVWLWEQPVWRLTSPFWSKFYCLKNIRCNNCRILIMWVQTTQKTLFVRYAFLFLSPIDRSSFESANVSRFYSFIFCIGLLIFMHLIRSF